MKLPNKVRGIAAVIIVLAGCTKKQDASIDTGSILQSSFVEPQFMAYFPGQKVGVWSFTPDESYAVVNSAWLPGFFERWKADLHDKGVVGWEGRFDCNKFAASYCAARILSGQMGDPCHRAGSGCWRDLVSARYREGPRHRSGYHGARGGFY
jgi:hypothetical protein